VSLVEIDDDDEDLPDAKEDSIIESRVREQALAGLVQSYVSPPHSSVPVALAIQQSLDGILKLSQRSDLTVKPLVCAVAEGNRVAFSWDVRSSSLCEIAVLCGYRASRKVPLESYPKVPTSCSEGEIRLSTPSGSAVFEDVLPGLHVVCLCSRKMDVMCESDPVTVGNPLSMVKCSIVTHDLTGTDSVLGVDYAIVADHDAIIRGDQAAMTAEREAYNLLASRGAYFGIYPAGSTIDAVPLVKSMIADWPINRVHLPLPVTIAKYECRLAITSPPPQPSVSVDASKEHKGILSMRARISSILPICQLCGEFEVPNEDVITASFQNVPMASDDLTDSCVDVSTKARVLWTCRKVDWSARPWLGVIEQNASSAAQALVRYDVSQCRSSHVSGIAYFDFTDYSEGNYAFVFFAHANDQRPSVAMKFRLPPA